jgi:hypothetical protein
MHLIALHTDRTNFKSKREWDMPICESCNCFQYDYTLIVRNYVWVLPFVILVLATECNGSLYFPQLRQQMSCLYIQINHAPPSLESLPVFLYMKLV